MVMYAIGYFSNVISLESILGKLFCSNRYCLNVIYGFRGLFFIFVGLRK